jgi:hypothetical protein
MNERRIRVQRMRQSDTDLDGMRRNRFVIHSDQDSIESHGSSF